MAKSKSSSTEFNFNSLKKLSLKLKIILMAVVALALLVSVVFFEPQINILIGFTPSIDNETTITGDGSASNVVSQRSSEEMIIHYIDVGQGDCVLIDLPDDDDTPKLMLIDGGTDKDKQKAIDYIDALYPDLRTRNDFYFEYVILTHADEDHCGGLDDLITIYGAKYIYRPNVRSTYSDYVDPALGKSGRNALVGSAMSGAGEKSTRAYMRFLASAYESSVSGSEVIVSVDPTTATADAMQKYINIYDENNDGDFEDEFDALLKFYTPLNDYYKDGNNYSPIMTLDYMGKRALFTGDAEKEAEGEFAQKYTRATFGRSADVVKLGHHGSRTSTSEGLLNIVTEPSKRANVLGIISCGAGNSYGHPHSEVLNRWVGMGFSEQNILRTDINSHIVLGIKFDAELNEGIIQFGTTKLRSYKEPAVRWAYIAFGIIGSVFVVLFILGTDWEYELNKKNKKSTKKSKKKASSKK